MPATGVGICTFGEGVLTMALHAICDVCGGTGWFRGEDKFGRSKARACPACGGKGVFATAASARTLEPGLVTESPEEVRELLRQRIASLEDERDELRAFVRWLAAPDADGVVEYIDPGEIQDKARTLLARKP